MALTAAEIRAVYTVDERPLDRSLGGLGGKVGGAFKGAVGAAAGLFAFSQISAGFMGLTGAASDLNETINKSSVIFGANAGKIDQWAKDAATNLGLSRQQALAAAAGFGDMFSQIGFSGDAAANMSKMVVQMSADLGSFNNLPTEDVAQRISAAFRGEYDSLQALIPNINAARVESQALAMTGKENAAALTAQEKAAAVLTIVNKDGARAMGDFAKTSDGAANAAKIATAQWEDQKAAIGQRLLPALTAMIGFVSGTVIPGVGKLVDFIADDAIPAVRDFAQWIEANKTPLLIIAGVIAAVFLPHLIALGAQSLATGAKSAAGWAMQKAGAIGGAAAHSAAIVGMIVRWVALGVAAVAQGVIIAAVWTTRIVASAVAGAVSFGVQVVRVVAGWVLMGAQAMAQAARMAAAWFIALGPVGWVIAAVIGLVALIVANWDTVVSWTQTAWSAVTGFIAGAWEWIKGAVAAGLDFLVGLFLNFTGVGLIIKHWDTIKRVTSDAWNAVSGAVSGAWNSLTGAISTGITTAVTWVSEMPGKLVGALGDIGSLLLDAGKKLIGGFVDGIKGTFGTVKDTLGNLTGKLFSWKGPPGKDKILLRDAGKLVIGGFVDGMESQYGAVRASLGGLTSDIAGMQRAVVAQMAALADTQLAEDGSRVGAGFYTKPPTGMVNRGGQMVPLSQIIAETKANAAARDTPGNGGGPLVNIEQYHEQPGSSPAATAAALGVEVRTRPWT